MNPLVIYHSPCSDGFCAAWLFHHAMPNAEFFPAQYSQDPPDVTGRRVFMVDFSYKRDIVAHMIERCESITILDHHKTAQKELEGLDGGKTRVTFDLSKSGGRLAWEYLYLNDLFPEEWIAGRGYSAGVAPWLVDYTEDRDLWRHRLLFSREINAAIRSYPMTFAYWDALHVTHKDGGARGVSEPLISQGAAILRDQSQTVALHVANAVEIRLAGHTVLAANASSLWSETAGRLAEGRPFGVCYFDRGDGMRVFSLRSTDQGIDVSEIAKLFGGGGHRNAAGFEIKTPAIC